MGVFDPWAAATVSSDEEDFDDVMALAEATLASAASPQGDGETSALPSSERACASAECEAECEALANCFRKVCSTERPKPSGQKRERPKALPAPANKKHQTGDFAKRSLRRHRSDGKAPGEPAALEMVCIWGGGGARSIPVVVFPFFISGGKKWVMLNEKAVWLRRAVGPKISRKSPMLHDQYYNALADLRKHIAAEIDQTVGGVAADVCKELGVSTEEIESAGPAKKKRRINDDEIPVKLEGHKILVSTCKRPALVELTKTAMNAVISYCREHVRGNRESSARTPKKEAEAPEAPSSEKPKFKMPTPECPPLDGKVTWQPSVESWAVHYKDAAKKRQVARIKAAADGPQSCALLGGSSPRNQFTEKRREAYIAAIVYWNQYDKSTRERIPVPTQ